MNNISDYIKYYKNVTFNESSFNDIDNILFSSIIYLDFKDIAQNNISLNDAGKKYFDRTNIKNLQGVSKKTASNFKNYYNSKRFKDVIISNYIKIVDDEKQFCAMTYKLPDGTVYVAYEGTDDSMIGWKEDFEMIYKFPVPSQKMAIDYINHTIKLGTKKIIVGGHSKGGNLAMTASMYAKSYVKNHIITVYNNDGPGFKKEQFESKEFKEMSKKLKMFVPEDCVIGFILRHNSNYNVIKSEGHGLFQHNPNTWKCYGQYFIPTSLSEDSKNIEKRIVTWLNKHDDFKRKQFVDTLFNSFKLSDINLFSDLYRFKFSKFIKLLRVSRTIDKESKDLVYSAFKILFLERNIDKEDV